MRAGRHLLLAGLAVFLMTAVIDAAFGVDVTWMAPLLAESERGQQRSFYDPRHDSAALLYGTPVAGGTERVILWSRDAVVVPTEDPALRLMALPAMTPDGGRRPLPARRLWLFGGAGAGLLILAGLGRALLGRFRPRGAAGNP